MLYTYIYKNKDLYENKNGVSFSEELWMILKSLLCCVQYFFFFYFLIFSVFFFNQKLYMATVQEPKYSTRFVLKNSSPSCNFLLFRINCFQLLQQTLWHFPPQLITFLQSYLLPCQFKCYLLTPFLPSLFTKQLPIFLIQLYSTFGYINIQCSNFMMV